MKTVTTSLLLLLALSGCSDASRTNSRETVPQLWSDHKQLSVQIDVCATKGEEALTSLGFTGVVRNGAFSYGNLNGNRAAVKCVDVPGGSFVYFSVAGANKEAVEKLRNEIAHKF